MEEIGKDDLMNHFTVEPIMVDIKQGMLKEKTLEIIQFEQIFLNHTLLEIKMEDQLLKKQSIGWCKRISIKHIYKKIVPLIHPKEL